MNKFNVGDKVIFTNSNGVYFGERTITEVGKVTYSESGYGYKIAPTDTPWFYISEECFKAISKEV